jgi:hypothetical protein
MTRRAKLADDAAYARLFEGSPDGPAVLDDLVTRFGGGLYAKGGEEGRRETDYRLGRRAVLDYIVDRINRAGDSDDSAAPAAHTEI